MPCNRLAACVGACRRAGPCMPLRYRNMVCIWTMYVLLWMKSLPVDVDSMCPAEV